MHSPSPLFMMKMLPSGFTLILWSEIRGIVGSQLVQTAVLFLFFSSLACAESYRSQVISTAEAFLEKKAEQTALEWNASNYKVRVRPLSENVRLPACKSGIQIRDFKQSPYGEQTLQAICPDNWKILLKGRIQIFLPVIVSRTTIPAKRQLKDEDIEWQSRDISITSSYLTQSNQVTGRYPKITIKPGIILNSDMLSVNSP